MNDNENKLICDALATADITKINAVCRDILLNRLQWDKQPDRKLRFLLEDVVKTISFPLSYEVNETLVDRPKQPHESSFKGKFVLHVVLIILGLGICFANITGLNILGIILAIIGSYGLGCGITPKPIPSVMKKSVIHVTTTAESLGQEVDKIYDILTRFYKYRQLDGRNSRILAWFQHFYADGATQHEKESIERLLALYGYTFCNFTEDNGADFEVNTGNVPTPTTTEPAIYNEDGVAVCKGTVVIPSLEKIH